MKIKKLFGWDLHFPLSKEQREKARKGMELLDITAEESAPSAPKGKNASRSSGDYASSKRFVEEISNPALKNVGVSRKKRNFSKDYPINTLVNADNDAISKMAADVLKDEARAQRYQEIFFSLFGEDYDENLRAYAASKGKSPEELTDEEHREAAHEFTAKIGSDGFSELLRAQKAKEIFEVAKDTPAFEDFDGKHYESNFDWINFIQHYYHGRTKHGTTVNIEDLEQDISANTGKRDLEDSLVLKEIFEQLSEEEKEILKLKGEGYKEAEIAKKLGYSSQGTISKKMKKLEKKITEHLK